MDSAANLSLVGAPIEAGAAGLLAEFDPALQPDLDITASNGVTSLQAAVSPDCSFRLVKAALEAAREEICLYIYSVTADHVLDLLRAAKARGIAIRIMFESQTSSDDEEQILEDLGVSLKPAPSTIDRPAFSLCHQKFAVIDGEILVLGSANWGDSGIPFLPEPGAFRPANREWVVRIDHARLATWFKRLFDADWDIEPVAVPPGVAAEPLLPEPVLAPVLLDAAPDRVFDVQRLELEEPARVTPIVSPNNYLDLAARLIDDATSSIDIQQQYILGNTPEVAELLAALERRKDEVVVRVMVSPRFPENWRRTVESMERFNLGGNLRAMNLAHYAHLHNKGLIIDRRQIIISSTNWSQNSIAFAREAGVLIDSAPVAAAFADVFDFDWSIARDPGAVPHELERLDELAALGQAAVVTIDAADIS